ncbi:DUF7097 family protein [Halanaeroarchaeum sulfurireducens]|uniref:Uncharacterized protein n=1 Tax=Halanaeroarchaeum sulfurireducens TaxID=1604004 RepID=A0A0F7PCG8_9EURY|nr:hypothetical protein [Halanaeroarchaeum sulfurireducens]AKH97058.1 hypothetical protein HLASF_0561 [Halanaeroarchaeum sulfurireducens]ALG81459.1 hypothetical protein HLASA_0558 [Halanaeroarchaeum sulfurireducens]
MKTTPSGTSVGVDDPYDHAEVCDHATGDGRCRFAYDSPGQDPEFSSARRAAEFRCPVADDEWTWADCPHYRYRASDRECARCGLSERRDAHDGGRPLLEEHHLAYDDDRDLGHEITVYLCRWCHAKVHGSWARIADDANPGPEALAALEERRSTELDELSFESAADRYASEE